MDEPNVTMPNELPPYLRDLEPVAGYVRAGFEAQPDDVGAWLLYVESSTRMVVDADLEDPDFTQWQSWYIAMMVERVGWPAMRQMVLDPAARAQLYARGELTVEGFEGPMTLAVPPAKIDEALVQLAGRVRW